MNDENNITIINEKIHELIRKKNPSKIGTLVYTEIGFIACKVDDFYIHEVVKIFQNNGYPKIQAMPGYFPQDMIPDEVKIGAHISLQYRKSTTAKHIEDLKRVTGINLHKWVCFSS